ncbi:MAG TPA: glutaredoxin family protein [Acidimicrobiales bacterium]|jgi:glutaredoxin|nr:glutaredoxin family protein [Acidimicrobiales bacterium]
MPVGTEAITVYWIPGCGNCTRLKGYLADRGVEFQAVDVQGDLEAFEDMKRAGILSMPSVRVGDRWATGFDLDQVDDLLGLTKDPAGRVLAIEELVERATGFVDAVCRLALQLPPDHYDDPTPTMDRFAAPFLFMLDGTPYVPHHSYKSLVHHIAGHAEKFKRFALVADGIHELGFAMEVTGEDAAFGEPEEATPMYRVIAQMALTANDIRAWRWVTPTCDLTRVIGTHYGPQTLHQLLQSMTCSLAQHYRQLNEILVERLGIEPDRPVGEKAFEGLLMPSGVWQ